MAQPDFYHLEVDSDNVEFTCYLNGVPVYMAEDEQTANVSLPVHLYMVGKDNKLKIEAEAIDNSRAGIIKAQVVAYQQGEIVTTDAEKTGETNIEMEVADKVTKEILFNNDKYDFSAVLVNGDKLSEEQVLEYAKELTTYKEVADAAGFVGEMELKIQDYSSSYPYTANQMRAGLTQQFEQSFFKEKSEAVALDRISVIGYNDGGIWEIRIDGVEFLTYNEDGGSMQMPVYVASVNGTMSIVR